MRPCLVLNHACSVAVSGSTLGVRIYRRRNRNRCRLEGISRSPRGLGRSHASVACTAPPCSPGRIQRAAAVLARYPLALRVDAELRSRRSNPSSSPRMNHSSRCAQVAYSRLLAQGEDPSAGKPGFWDELLLLRVNAQYLEVHPTRTRFSSLRSPALCDALI